MWHGAYLSWLEEGRVDALASAGLPYDRFSKDGFEMPVVFLEIKYLSALNHGDEVILESWPMAQKGIRWPWYTKFWRHDGTLSAEAKVDLVLVSRKNGSVYRPLRKAPDHIELALNNVLRGPVEVNW